jgi:serine/threonine-protein kinase
MNGRERSASSSSADATPASGAAPLAARYRSLFEIGRGGMATIEVALERSSAGFERIVALKRLHPHSARERRQTEAFAREARLAVWLVHPNVVHAFDFGETDGELFLAMEYVEGESLSTMIRAARDRSSGPLPPEIVASILADACEGLHAAHELRDPTTGSPLNVIHRDVSPQNVMVSYEGHVKLLDFGVAKMDSVDPLTRTGEVKGKTAYMSPEQAMGETLDRRSDLFSMGAVLFECVSGRKMWGNGTDLDVLRKLALEPPPSLADAAPLAPQELVDLCARMVAKSPRDRPSSAQAVAMELRAFAAKSEPPVTTYAIAGVMQTLFAAQARQRREMLDQSVEKAGPTARVEVLRKSLAGPTALASLRPSAIQAPAQTGLSESAPAARAMEKLETISPPATKRGLLVSAVVGLVVAIAIVVVTNTRAPPEGAQAAAPVQPMAIASANASPTPTADATPTPTPNATSTSTSTPTPTPSATPTPNAPPPPSSHHRPKPAPSAPHVDVDPHPF